MILSLLVIGTCSLYIYLAALSLTIKPRTVSHWLLFASACCAAYWAFFAFFAYNADTLEELRVWVSISVLGMFPYFPLNLLFVISVVPGRKLTVPLAAVITLPAAALFVLNLFYPVVFSDFMMGEKGWIFVPAIGRPFNFCWIAYFSICFVGSVVLLVIWRITTIRNREKRQMGVLVTSQAVAILLIFLEYRFHEYLVQFRSATISPVLLVIWVLGMVIAMKRYQFLSITPETVGKEILNSIREIIILIDDEEKITYMNRRALSFFGVPYRKLDHRDLGAFITGGEKTPSIVPSEIKADDQVSAPSVTVDLTFYTYYSGTAGVSMRVSRIHDKYGDPLGYLFVGHEVIGVGQLQERWDLTEREAEIVIRISKGHSNAVIAEELDISEQTVKNHIAHVYRKLNVSNRVELINIIGNSISSTDAPSYRR